MLNILYHRSIIIQNRSRFAEQITWKLFNITTNICKKNVFFLGMCDINIMWKKPPKLSDQFTSLIVHFPENKILLTLMHQALFNQTSSYKTQTHHRLYGVWKVVIKKCISTAKLNESGLGVGIYLCYYYIRNKLATKIKSCINFELMADGEVKRDQLFETEGKKNRKCNFLPYDIKL